MTDTLTSQVVLRKNWYQTAWANGKEMLDGNPIFSCLLVGDKAIRIIQEEPETPQPYLNAWIQNIENEQQNTLQELVISLELSAQTKSLALKMAQHWATQQLNNETLQELIKENLNL